LMHIWFRSQERSLKMLSSILLGVIIALLVLDLVLKYTRSSERVNIPADIPAPIDLDPTAKWGNTTSNLVKRTPISHTDKVLYEKEIAKNQGR